MVTEPDPSLRFTLPFQLTRTVHRQPYDRILPYKEENKQAGRIILITGGGSGIGAAAAKVWTLAGAAGVVLAGRRVERLEKVSAELRRLPGNTRVLTVRTDVTVEQDVRHLLTQIQSEFGQPADVLFQSAGTMSPALPLDRYSLEEWWADFETNVKSLFLLTQNFIRVQPDPTSPSGTIFFVSSALGGLVQPMWSAYATSKLAAQRFIEHVHAEYPSLRAFTIVPGIVDTEFLNRDFVSFALDDVSLTGMLALWLMHPEADFLRGQLVSVNWDVDEMLAHKTQINDEKLLQIKWHPVLPCGGGTSLSA